MADRVTVPECAPGKPGPLTKLDRRVLEYLENDITFGSIESTKTTSTIAKDVEAHANHVRVSMRRLAAAGLGADHSASKRGRPSRRHGFPVSWEFLMPHSLCSVSEDEWGSFLKTPTPKNFRALVLAHRDDEVEQRVLTGSGVIRLQTRARKERQSSNNLLSEYDLDFFPTARIPSALSDELLMALRHTLYEDLEQIAIGRGLRHPCLPAGEVGRTLQRVDEVANALTLVNLAFQKQWSACFQRSLEGASLIECRIHEEHRRLDLARDRNLGILDEADIAEFLRVFPDYLDRLSEAANLLFHRKEAVAEEFGEGVRLDPEYALDLVRSWLQLASTAAVAMRGALDRIIERRDSDSAELDGEFAAAVERCERAVDFQVQLQAAIADGRELEFRLKRVA
ncbi:MAG: hypothetical protein WCF24_05605 [Acidimicrobiales bacterium]